MKGKVSKLYLSGKREYNRTQLGNRKLIKGIHIKLSILVYAVRFPNEQIFIYTKDRPIQDQRDRGLSLKWL